LAVQLQRPCLDWKGKGEENEVVASSSTFDMDKQITPKAKTVR
jgi:hypothetical protein